jgi:hypothetical protein
MTDSPTLPAAPVASGTPIDAGRLLAMANHQFGKAVDCDMKGTPITDFQVLLQGAYRQAVMRLVNLAVARHPGGPPLDKAVLDALAEEAYAQEVDIDFSNQPIQSYKILFQQSYGYGRHVAQLVELARTHAPVLRT